MSRPTVTIFGSSSPTAGEPAYREAYELGQCIAQAGWTVCNGGYGGTMAASAEGAVAAGGHTIGVTCRGLGRRRANPHVRQEVPTFDLFQRLNTLLRLGDGYVVLPGGSGTLVELALAIELSHKSLLRKRPIVLLGGHWSPVVDLLGRAQNLPDIVVSVDAAGVVAALSAWFADGRARSHAVS